jgi:hypothetical protein
MHDRAYRPCREHASAERVRPTLGVILHRQIERRLVGVSHGDGTCGLCPIILLPACHQPLRRIECAGIDAGEKLRGLAGDAPEHGVDQAGVARRAAVGLHQAHRKIHGSVVWYLEPKDLRRAEKQGGFHPRRAGGKF